VPKRIPDDRFNELFAGLKYTSTNGFNRTSVADVPRDGVRDPGLRLVRSRIQLS
jgi:hypothetical protein